MPQYSSSTQAALDKKAAEDKAREAERAHVRDIAKLLGAEFDPSDHHVKRVKTLLADLKREQAHAAQVRANAANSPAARRPFSSAAAHF